MTTTSSIPTVDDARLSPLISDSDIERRVSALIGRANVRQLWLLFLDGDSVQLPLVIPIDGIPSQPSKGDTELVVSNIADMMLDIRASSFVAVWERYGSAKLTPQDAAWARSLHHACADQGVALRAMLLSHRTGVSWISPSDFELA
jgi:hypothetical protein